MQTTEDLRAQLVERYNQHKFKTTKTGVVTVELQNVQFEADKDWIIRKPNYDYAGREIQWYESQSLNVYDIPGDVPTIWKNCADKDGMINSNYGWMIWSKENGDQYNNCLKHLVNDPASREAVMIYNRPSMHEDATKNGMHDFCCTFSTQCFLDEEDIDGKKAYRLKYIVYQRSCDSVFGYDNDILWHKHVYDKLREDLSKVLDTEIIEVPIVYNIGSLHVYERHFKYLN